MAEAMKTRDIWQSEYGEVRMRLTALLERGLWTDCELAVGAVAERIPAHRILLASASPVLASMIYGTLPTPPDQPLPLPEIEPDIAQLLLKYIYTDNIVLNSCDVACNLYRAAHYLLITHLVEVCKTYLVSNVSPKSVLLVYEFAELFDESQLADKCLQVMKENASKVLQSVGSKASLSLQVKTLSRFFALPDLNVNSEMELLVAADRWVQQKQAAGEGQHMRAANRLDEVAENNAIDSHPKAIDMRLLQLVRPVLQEIRFLAIDPDEFTQYDTTHLLSSSELLAISFNLCSNNSRLAMPTGFTTSRQPRKPKNVIKMKVRVSELFSISFSEKIILDELPWRMRVVDNGILVECNWDMSRSITWDCAVLTAKARMVNQTCKLLSSAELKNKLMNFHLFSWKDLSLKTLINSYSFVVDDEITFEVYIVTKNIRR